MTADSSRKERSREDKEKRKEDNDDKDINIHHDKKLSNKPLSLRKTILKSLGPGIITGASDDDPSTIATFSKLVHNSDLECYGLLYFNIL